MTQADTTTCDACGKRYTFTSYKDRCPICCPKQDDKTDDYELDDWGEWRRSDNRIRSVLVAGFLCPFVPQDNRQADGNTVM